MVMVTSIEGTRLRASGTAGFTRTESAGADATLGAANAQLAIPNGISAAAAIDILILAGVVLIMLSLTRPDYKKID